MKNTSYDTIKNEFVNLIKDYPNFPFDDRKAQELVAEHILEQVFEKTHIYVTSQERKVLLRELLDTVVFGLRQVQKLQDDPDIEEIMINGLKDIFIKRRFSDGIERVNIEFSHKNELRSVIEKLLEGTGRRVDRSTPIVDTRLADGSRVNIIIEPLSLQGPVITIRKFPEKPITAEDLVKHKTLNQEMYEFLKNAVINRKNIVVSGSTAAGKTTTLSALLDFIEGEDTGERLVLIEQIAEIKLPKKIKNRIQLETRPPNLEGKGEYTIRELLKNALRMRPDRIIIGEVRGGEAFDLLQALNTGHEGSFTTLHANSVTDALLRLESMVLLSGFEQLPLQVIRTWIRRSIDIVIQQKKIPGRDT
jgi:pilus assembly protein CpaF